MSAPAFQTRAEAAAQATASGARMSPADFANLLAARRAVGIHLTPFAPRLAHAAIDDKRRWISSPQARPLKAVQTALVKIGRRPDQVSLGDWDGEPALFAPIPDAERHHVSGDPDRLVPFAVFHTGVTAPEARACLEQLAAEGWTPADDQPAH